LDVDARLGIRVPVRFDNPGEIMTVNNDKGLIGKVLSAVVVFGAAVAGIGSAGCATTTERLNLQPPTTVAKVDLNRYLGKWYDIASFPQWFQKGCTATTAEYSLKDNGEIKVVNSCRKGSLDGKQKVSVGRARVVDKDTNSKLEVSFFGPFWGNYWILDLGENYEYSVVGDPSRDYLWILSRTPQMDGEVYRGIVERLKAQGYELDRLQKTLQPGDM